MKYNKSEIDATKKSGVISTVGVGNTGAQNNTVSLNNEEAQRGSERASEVVVVVD